MFSGLIFFNIYIISVVFLQAWTWLSGLRSGPAAGGSVLSFYVYGLETNVEYFCMFVGGSNKKCSSAYANGNSSISCMSVPWGISFPSETVGIYLVVGSCGLNEDERGLYYLAPATNWSDQFSFYCSYPTCWTFESVWNYSDASAGANGGGVINVIGYGFDNHIKYKLTFFGYVQNVSTQLRLPTSPTSIVLITPFWNGAEETVSIRLEDEQGNEVQNMGKTHLFTFLSCWLSKDVSSSPALLTDLSTIIFRGAGFDRLEDGYECVFSRETYSIRTVASALDVNILICSPPIHWAYRAGVATIGVMKNRTNLVLPCQTNSSGDDSFLFLDGWLGLSLSQAPAIGGLNVSFLGYGFDISALACKCRFWLGIMAMNHSCWIFSDSNVVCQTPTWGSRFKHGTVSVDLIVDDKTVQYMNRSSSAQFTFFEVWRQAYTEADLNVRDSVLGGALLTVTGSGFDVSASYRCVFGTDNAVYSSSVASDTTSILFTVPLWNGAAQSVQLMIMNLASGLIVSRYEENKFVRDLYFEYVPIWKSIRSGSTSLGENELILGNCTMWISGSGFNQNMDYTCRFTPSNGTKGISGLELSEIASFDSPAVVLNQSLMQCTSPRFVKGSGWTRFSVYDLSGNELVGPRNATYKIPCSWFDISPSYGSVLGGTLLTILGDEFDVTKTYICNFSAGSHFETSSANISGSNSLICEVPAWNDKNQKNISFAIFEDGEACIFVKGIHCTTDYYFGFEFVPSIGQVMPTRSSALGGTSLLIYGTGFLPENVYMCVFTSMSVGCPDSVESVMQYVDNSTSTCVVPFWPCEAGIVALSFEGLNKTISFVFIPIVNFTSQTQALAKGGFQLTVYGAGFSFGRYFAVFSENDIKYSHENCHAEVSIFMFCNITAWRYEAGSVSLSFLSSSGENVSSLSSLRFVFLAGWDLINPSQNTGPSSGNTSVSIIAYGLNCQMSFNCSFNRKGQQLQGSGVCQSPQLLECTTPAWGAIYEAGPVYLSIVSSGFHIVPFTNNAYFEIDSTVCAEDCEGAVFTFLSEWKASESSPTSLAAYGNEAITVRGYGFSSMKSYSLIMATKSDQPYELFSNQYTFVGPSSLIFFSPNMPAPLWNLSLKLLENGKNISFQSGTCIIAIVPGIFAVYPSQGPAAGSTLLQVHGFGLKGQNLRCDINGTPSESTNATSSDQAICILPPCLGGAQTVAFTLYSITFMTNVAAFRLIQSASRVELFDDKISFTYFPEIDRITPTFADRLGSTIEHSSEIATKGFGFNWVHTYFCRFTSQSNPSRIFQSKARFLSVEALACNTPHWDLVTPWQDYNESKNIAILQVFTDPLDNPTGWLDPQAAQVQNNFVALPFNILGFEITFVQINTAPFFSVRSNFSRLMTYLTIEPVVIPELIQYIRPGETEIEKFQKLTFYVSAPNIFLQFPWISQNGSLSFILSSGVLPSNPLVMSTLELNLQVVFLISRYA